MDYNRITSDFLAQAYSSVYNPEEQLSEEGKKDACYHKVKASAKVWPSAYASGRLVQCRKKGADSYGKGPKKEELEMVFSFLIQEGFAETEDAALAMLESMSEEWYGVITEEIYTEGMADQGVDSDEAMKRHGIKKHEGEMKVKKLKPRKARKGEGLGVGARKRQGVTPPRADNPADGGAKKN